MIFLLLFITVSVILLSIYFTRSCMQARERVKRKLDESSQGPLKTRDDEKRVRKSFPDVIHCRQYPKVEFESQVEQYKRVTVNGYEVDMPMHRPVRVYCDGIYDMFHAGHALSLKQAKELFPNTVVVVGVCNDEITHRLKGKTVMFDDERYEAVSHCRYVDEVIINAPWVTTQEFLDKHKIDFVIHGEDITYDENGVDTYKWVKDIRKFIAIKRTEGISTTDLIMRIVKDYDSYVRRNFSRGYSRKDMNVGFMKEKQLKMEEKFEEWQMDLIKMQEKSRTLIKKFIDSFSKKQRLVAAGASSPGDESDNSTH